MQTLEQRFEGLGQQSSGFDYLRIILAFSILAWHGYGITYGRDAIDAYLRNGYAPFSVYLVIPAFFALSGFLVTASFYRTKSIKTYLVFRSLRIFPALMVEVALSALVLGAIYTDLNLSSYFMDIEFYKYFLNIIGLVQYELPEVFINNKYPDVVNGSLWTIPYELECYIYVIIFYYLGIYNKRNLFIALFIVLTFVSVYLGFTSAKGVIVFIKTLFVGDTPITANLQELGLTDTVNVSRITVLSFFAGSLIYAWKDKIPYHSGIAIISFVFGIYLLSDINLYYYSPIFLAYSTVWLGLQNPKKWNFLRTGDYSYGVYLYAFPLQQMVSNFSFVENNYLLNVLFSSILVLCFAVLSWHFIEKPALSLKKKFLR